MFALFTLGVGIVIVLGLIIGLKMNAFIDKVKAQRGKKINEDDADLLIARAEEIIKLIEDGLGN